MVDGKKYPFVHVSFLDHCMLSGDLEWEPIPCELVGYLVQETKGYWVIATWISGGVLNNEDTEMFVVVKHPGATLRKLK